MPISYLRDSDFPLSTDSRILQLNSTERILIRSANLLRGTTCVNISAISSDVDDADDSYLIAEKTNDINIDEINIDNHSDEDDVSDSNLML